MKRDMVTQERKTDKLHGVLLQKAFKIPQEKGSQDCLAFLGPVGRGLSSPRLRTRKPVLSVLRSFAQPGTYSVFKHTQ